MDKIEIVYKELGPGVYHKYLLFTKDNGNGTETVYYARGGPSIGFVGAAITGGTLGYLDTEYGLYINGTPDYINPLLDDRHRELVTDGANLQSLWNSILIAMDDIDQQYMYLPTSQNSNTSVDLALLAAGQSLPEDDDAGDFFSPASGQPPFWSPCVECSFSNDMGMNKGAGA